MMRHHYKRNPVLSHLYTNRIIYIFSIVLVLMGVIFGAVIVNSMTFQQKNDLYAYLTLFFNEAAKGEFAGSAEIFFKSYGYYLKVTGFIWLLGLSVIGLPVIFLLLFTKGLMVGFTVGFMVDQMGFEGFILAFSSVFPQNVFLIPVFIAAASAAAAFSVTIWKLIVKRGYEPVLQLFISYSLFFTVMAVISGVAALFEAFISPRVIQFVIETFIF